MGIKHSKSSPNKMAMITIDKYVYKHNISSENILDIAAIIPINTIKNLESKIVCIIFKLNFYYFIGVEDNRCVLLVCLF